MSTKSPILAIGLCSLALSAQAATPCAEQLGSFQQNLTQGQTDAAATQLAALENACPPETVKTAKRQYTDILAKAANDLVNDGQLDAASGLLDQAQALSWTVASVRGDIAAKRKKWQEAARQYGQAFQLLTEPGHVAPDEIDNLQELQGKLYALASDAQLLYGKLDETSVTRGGEAQGILLASEASRGFKVKKIAVPVHFETNQATLNPDGLQSAVMLTKFLRGKTGKKVILTGFADPRGSDAHNQALSEARARTVAAYLQEHGVGIPIETLGKGKTVPPQVTMQGLSQDEQWALWRRVELQLLNQ